jgi:hypothetical protein
VYSCKEKGGILNQRRGAVQERYQISFNVSELEWDEFPGQVEDAIGFLEKWGSELLYFKAEYQPDELLLDFPIYSRLNGEIINQNDYLPSKLVSLAGQLGLSIGMSIYSKEAFDD